MPCTGEVCCESAHVLQQTSSAASSMPLQREGRPEDSHLQLVLLSEDLRLQFFQRLSIVSITHECVPLTLREDQVASWCKQQLRCHSLAEAGNLSTSNGLQPLRVLYGDELKAMWSVGPLPVFDRADNCVGLLMSRRVTSARRMRSSSDSCCLIVFRLPFLVLSFLLCLCVSWSRKFSS